MIQSYTKPYLTRPLFLLLLCLLGFFGTARATKYYVSSSSGSDGNSTVQAQSSSTPWQTLVFAISQAATGDSIVVLPGTYTETNVAVTKSLKLFGNETAGVPGTGTRPVFNGSSSILNGAIFVIQSTNVVIRNFEIHVEQSFNTIAGIYSAAGGFNGLLIADNHIYSTRIGVNSVFNSYGLLLGRTVSNAGNDSSLIVRNVIRPLAPGRAHFGRGIRLNGGYSTIGGVAEADSNFILGDYGIQCGSALNTMRVLGNHIFALSAGVELNFPAPNRTHLISGNRFSPIPGFPSLSMIELKNNTRPGSNILIENNQFNGHDFFGVFSSRSRNVVVRNNVFIPSDTARGFIHIVSNTKQQTASTTETATNSGIKVYSNNFLANPFPGGRGISFQNHFAGANPPFTDVEVGGAGSLANTFASNLEQFVVLDTSTGSSKRLPIWDQAAVPSSPMVPVEVDFDISQNLFDLGTGAKLPADMSNSELLNLENRLLHQIDFDSLGFLTVVPNTAFVTTTSFASPKSTSPSVNRAVSQATTDGWNILIEPGSYNDQVTITQSLGMAAEPANTVTLQGITLNGAGKTLSLASAFRLSSSLTLIDGQISLSSGDLILDEAATLTGGSDLSYAKTQGTGKFIHRNLGSIARRYPIGTSSSYLPVTVANSGTSDDLGLRVFTDVLAGGFTGSPVDSVVGLTWVADEGTAGGSNLSFTPQWNASHEKPFFTRTSTSLQGFIGGGWSNISGNSLVAATGADPFQATYSGLTNGFSNLPIRIRNYSLQGSLYYVDDATGLDTRTPDEAKNPATPWKTIGKALATVTDGDSVQVFAGTYAEANLRINSGVKLFGNVVGVGTGPGAGTGVKPVVNGTGLGPDSSIFTVQAANVLIRNFQIEVNQSLIIHGILARTSGYNNVTIQDNLILSMALNASALPCLRFNTYGIRLVGYQTDRFTIQRNEIRPRVPDGTICFFGRGIKLFGGHGLIGGPVPADSNRILAYYSIQTGDADGGSVEIRNNFLLGIGVQIVAPAANSGVHSVADNRFFVAFPQFFPTQFEIKDVQKAGTSISVRSNVFSGYSNSALFSQRAQNVLVENNIFQPVDTARNFRSIIVNTKQETIATSQPPVLSGISIKGNQFRAGTFTNSGTALEFGNHNDDPGSATAFSNVVIGGAGAEANQFAGNHRNWMVLDPLSGPSTNWFFWAQYPVTLMAPVADNFDIRENLFTVSGGDKRPSAMTTGELYEVEDKIQHGIDIGSLGFVTVSDNQAFVTTNSFAAPFSSQPSLQRAHDKISDGFTVFVQPQTLNEVARLTRSFTLDANPSGRVALRGIHMIGSGNELTTADSVLISDSLDLASGFINLGAGSLVMANAAVLGGGSPSGFVRTNATGRFVHENLGTVRKNFPLGVGTAYTPLSLSNSGVTDRIGVRVTDGVLDNGNQVDTVVGVTWFLNESEIGGSNFDARFQWPGSKERTGFNRNAAFVDQFLFTGWSNLSGLTPIASTGSDPYELSANLQASFSSLALRVTSKVSAPQVGGTLFYVDDNTGDDNRTNLQATDPNTPWRTLAKALASVANGDSVQVFPGNYPEGGLVVDKSVSLFGSVIGIGTGVGAGTGTKPIINGITGGPDSALFWINSDNVTLNNFQLEVNQTSILHGIFSRTGVFNNTRILNSFIFSTGVNTSPGLPCIRFNTYGLRFINGGTDSLVVKGCFIQPLDFNFNCAFGRGIRTFSGGRVVVGGPLDSDTNRIIARYGVQLGDLRGQASLVQRNAMAGQGVEITAPSLNSGIHQVLQNRIFPLLPQIFLTLIETKDVQRAGTGVHIEGNLLSGHSNIGVFVERSRNVTVVRNTFIPSDTAVNYRHISVNTKQQTFAASQPPGINSVTIQGNDLRSASVQGGVGIEFGNHNDNPAQVNAFTDVVIGGLLGDANQFGPNLRYFFRLDPQTGLSNTVLPWTPYPVTPMRPVADTFNIAENIFTVSGGAKRPASMTDAEYFELEDKVLHGVDYDSLGFVTWKASYAYLTPNSFIAPYTSTPSLQRAVNETGPNDGWTVNIQPNALNEVVEVRKSMIWNTFPADSIRLGGIIMNGSDKILTLADRFILTNALTLSNPLGGKISIGNNDLFILPGAVVTQGSANSYVQTDGTGNFVYRGVDDQLRFYPIGTADSYAPVTFDDANNTGDNIRAQVKPASTVNDFTPPLPATITTFVKFQWNICEDSEGGSDAVLRFDWSDPLNVEGSGTINSISRNDGTNWNSTLATIGPGLVANGFNFNTFCSPFAVIGDPNLTAITTGNIVKIGPGIAGRFCPGDSVDVPFTVVGTGLVPGNNFNAFLSNPDGTFPPSGGNLMGSLQGNTTGVLKGVIPLSTAPGINYRVRIVSDNIQIVGVANPDSIKIFALPDRPVITGDSALCLGETTTLSSSAAVSYLWTPGNTTDQTLPVSGSGTFRVTITDVNGCTNRSAVRNVSVLPSPVAEPISFTGSLIRCAGDSIVLTANPDGLNYSWLNTNPLVTTRTITAKASGSFQVVISNANGCADTSEVVTVTFNALPAKPVVTSANDTVCQPSSLVFESTAATSYEWSITGISPNPSTQAVTLTEPGSYTATVTVTNAENCRNTSDPFVGLIKRAPLAPQITTVGGDASVCEGDTIRVVASPFFPSNTYTWGPSGQATSQLIITQPGTQLITVSVDSVGCTTAGQAAFAVNVNPRPALPVVTLTQGQNSFCQGDSATLSSSVASGYLWSPGGETNQNIVVRTSGIYSVVVLSDSGCASLPSVSANVEARKNPEKPLVNASQTVFCFGEEATLTVTNDAAGNVYVWSPSSSGTSLTVSQTGSYTVRADSTNNCSTISDPVGILVNPVPEPVITTSVDDNRICFGDSVVLTSNFASGNVWNGVSGNPTNQTIVLRSTTPSITLRVTDANGCSSTAGPVNVQVDVLPQVRLLKDTAIVVRDDLPLKADGYPSNAATFSWFKGSVLLSETEEDTYTIIGDATSPYSVVLTDSNGCQAIDSILVRVSREVYIPNSFSPNKDGKNDRFKVYGFGVATVEFKIWDRLGNLVFETNKVEDIIETEEDGDVKGWDGTYEGKELSQESYIWSIKGTFDTGEPLRVTGGNNSGSVIILN